MDPPPYLHHQHHSRYVPFSPSPPAHPPPFQQSPNLYPPRHHSHHLPPPPPPPVQQQQLLPPQEQQSYHPLAGPAQPPPQQHRPYNPHNPQFTFSPKFNPKPNSASEFHDFPQRPLFDQERTPRRVDDFEARSDLCPDNRLPRPHPVPNLDRAAHYSQFDRRPMSPVDRFMRDLEGSSRFRDDYDGDRFKINQREREEFVRLHSDRLCPERTSRDFGIVSRGFELCSVNGDKRYDSAFDHQVIRSGITNGVSENLRWGHDRQSLRDVDVRDEIIEKRNKDNGDRDELRIFSRKLDYHDAEVERYNDSGSRESSHEYNRTPRKQIQKKSALLRIQMAKPSSRNREDERPHYSGYFNESKSSCFRGKDMVVHSDRSTGEKDREGTPVELDVSFKSNALVAKAIVGSSSSAVVSDSSLTPRNRKIRKVMASSNKDSSSTQLTKVNEGTVKLDRASYASVPGSEKDSKRSERKFTISGVDSVQDNVRKLSSNGANVSLRKSSVKRTSKDTVKLDGTSCVVTSGPTSDKYSKQPEEKSKSPGIGSASDSSRQPCSNETSVSLEKSKLETSPKSFVSDKGDANVSKMPSVKVAKKKKVVRKVVRKVTNSPSWLPNSQSEKKLDETVKTDDSAHSILATSSKDKGVTPLKMNIPFANAGSLDGFDPHHSPRKETLHPENEKKDASSKSVVLGEFRPDVGPHRSSVPKGKRKRTSDHDKSKLDEAFISSGSSKHTISKTEDPNKLPEETIAFDTGEDVAKGCSEKRSEGSTILDESNSNTLVSSSANLNSSSSNSLQINVVCEMVTMDAGCKQPCTEPVIPLVESSAAVPSFSCTEEAKIHRVPKSTDCSNHGRCNVPDSDICYINSVDGNHEIGDSFGMHLSPQKVTISHEENGQKGSNVAMASVGNGEEDVANVKNQRKIGITELDLSSTACTDLLVGSVNVVNSESSVDTTLSLSVKNDNPVDATVGVGYLDTGIQQSKPEVGFLRRSSSNADVSEAKLSVDSDLSVPNRSSPENKRRKLSNSGSTPTASMIGEGFAVVDMHCSDMQLLFNSDKGLLQSEQEVIVSGKDALDTDDLPPSSEVVTELLTNGLAGESQVAGSTRRANVDDGMAVGQPTFDLSSAVVEPAAQSPLSLCPPGSRVEQIPTATPVTGGNEHQSSTMDAEGGNRKEVDVDASQQIAIICPEAVTLKTLPNHLSSGFHQRLPGTDVEFEGYLHLEEDLPSASNSLVLAAGGDGVSIKNSSDEQLIPPPDILSDVGSPEIQDTPVICSLPCTASQSQNLEETVSGNKEILADNPMVEGDLLLSASTLHSMYRKSDLKPNDVKETDHLLAGKVGVVPSQDFQTNNHLPNPVGGEAHGRKNQLNHAVPRSYPARSPYVFTASKNMVSSTNVTRPRTWHRTSNSSASPLPVNKQSLSTIPMRRQMPTKVAKSQATSYIRKGNSLVRKPASVAAFPQGSSSSSSVSRLSSLGVDEVNKGSTSDNRANVVDSPSLLKTGVNTPMERPRTPPIPSVTKVPCCQPNLLGDLTSSSSVEPPLGKCCETTTDQTSCLEANDLLNSSEDRVIPFESLNQSGSGSNLESRTAQIEGGLVSSSVKNITYVKPKSYQLIATSDHCNSSMHNNDKSQSLSSSDGYYKRSKNQLIRTAFESYVNQTVTLPADKSNSAGQVATKVILGQAFSKKRSNKVVSKAYKPSKFSLVWTLHGAKSPKNDGDSLHCAKVFPQLFPWKRRTYWRNFMFHSVSARNTSLSTISRKLLQLRKRNAVYTRSLNGFSLRKSKVLSVGGYSLKWSKSIERHSKKANEEATLAVAAAVRRKREQNVSTSRIDNKCSSSNRSLHGTELLRGERIFRIGSVRYKMDSSRQTLQRISDDESSCPADLVSKKSIKKSFVPRRLVIGNDEYVRIGNGNQLVRDPKKRTRVLASEKVRWSLHTARLRARKRKYCQFFTRFGKCNKDDGKCPYIHDPSKIAVCTKFLRGLCSNPSCILTHKIIPERMPDCSYFLQGLCTNEKCPYRHVHVNPSAPTCGGFLRGYCADGNECRKKHSYVCPIFEATGSCPQGTKCKLHHPKKRCIGKKSRRSKQHKNGHGRYFGSMHVDILEPGRMVSERHLTQDNDDNLFEGRFSDYISLDVSDDEEAGESNDAISEHTTCGDNDLLDSQLDDIDELIKPIRIMNKN